MDADEHPGLFRCVESPPQGGVIDHQSIGIGHVELHAGHPLLDQPGKEPPSFAAVLRNASEGEVEAEVDGGAAIGFGVPFAERFVGALAPRACEVQDAGGPSAGRRHRPALEVVGRAHRSYREIEVRVHVDPARDHQRPTRVHDLRARGLEVRTHS